MQSNSPRAVDILVGLVVSDDLLLCGSAVCVELEACRDHKHCIIELIFDKRGGTHFFIESNYEYWPRSARHFAAEWMLFWGSGVVLVIQQRQQTSSPKPQQRRVEPMQAFVEMIQNMTAWHQCASLFQLQHGGVIRKHMPRPQETYTLSRATSSIGARLSGVWKRGTTSSSTTCACGRGRQRGARQQVHVD